MFESLNIQAVIDTVSSEQKTHIETHNRYKQYVRTSGDVFDWEVHEHDNQGKVGYTIYFYASNEGKNYLKSVGTGEGSRTSDWTELTEI